MEALLTKIVFLVSIGFLIAILFILLKRHLQKRFFWFLVYVCYVLVEAVVRLSVAGNKLLYFYVYWLTAIGTVIFSVLALRESFLNVFWMYTRFRWLTRIVWGCVGLALLYSAFRAWVFPPVHASKVTTVAVAVESAVNYSFCAIGLLYFLLVRFDKIRQHQWESAIISGFFTIGTISVFAVLTRSVFGAEFRIFSQWAEPVAYILAEIEWVFVLSRPERETPKRKPGQKLTVDDLTRFDEYISVLDRLLGRRR